MLRWSLQQLYNYNGKPFVFKDILDFEDRIGCLDDILSISTVKVEGTGEQLFDDRYTFKMHIECTLGLECARTLEKVDYKINLDVEEIFDTKFLDPDEDINIIPKNTIDLRDVIFEDIILKRPVRIFKEGTTPVCEDYKLTES